MRFLSIILSLFLFAQTVSASPLSGNAKTKRIPAGTKFALQLTNSVSTTNSEGSEFTAIMMNDQTADQDVILPMGSLVRGTIKRIEPSIILRFRPRCNTKWQTITINILNRWQTKHDL